MPAYNPPMTHYSQVPGLQDKELMFSVIGKDGHNFKYLTEKLELSYIWWDMKRNVIELWGPESKLVKAQNEVQKYMNKKTKNMMTNLEYAMMDMKLY